MWSPSGSAPGVWHSAKSVKNRIVVAYRRLEQALEVGSIRRHHDLETRRVHEPTLQIVIVLATDAPTCSRECHHDHRESELATGQIAKLASAVDDGVHGQREKGREEEIHDRA